MSARPEQSGHDRCGVPGRGSGKPCRLPAGWGTDHPGVGKCRKHFGSSPNHQVAAVEEQARQAAAKFGVPVRTKAREALADELARCNGMVVYLTARCQELAEAGELVWGQERRIIKQTARPSGQQGQPTVEVHHAARPHPLVLMLERERRHLAQVAIECERLRIEVRMTTAAEQQAAQLKRILDLALAQAGFSAEEQRRVVTALPNVIRQLSAVPDA